jgi:hypothetical protein
VLTAGYLFFITDHHGLLNRLGGCIVRLRSDERAIGGNGSGGLD